MQDSSRITPEIKLFKFVISRLSYKEEKNNLFFKQYHSNYHILGPSTESCCSSFSAFSIDFATSIRFRWNWSEGRCPSFSTSWASAPRRMRGWPDRRSKSLLGFQYFRIEDRSIICFFKRKLDFTKFKRRYFTFSFGVINLINWNPSKQQTKGTTG